MGNKGAVPALALGRALRHRWMSAMLRGTPIALAALLLAPTALAQPHATAPAGGGLAALDVKVDLTRSVVNANGVELPIGLDRAQLPAEGAVTVESAAVGLEKHVVHVRVPASGSDEAGPAWEAILAAGRPAPIFSGLTGFTAGDPGERTGKAVQLVPNGEAIAVLVGDVREDLRICGQTVTLLDPLMLYPAQLELRGPVTVQRLSAKQMASAEKIAAVDKGPTLEPPLAKLLVARGSSVPNSRGLELTDGDARTVWREGRPGAGKGEFVAMAAPKGVPIKRIGLVVSPPDADKASNGAAPKTLYVVTNTQTFEVTVPGDAWSKPGEAYEIAFPQPIESTCVTLVLDSAYTRGLAHPDVGVAEMVAYSELDAPGATLDDLAKRLSSDRGFAAAQVLERAGDAALAAVVRAYDGLDARGRALAIDVAASQKNCEDAAPLFARGLCESGGEAPRRSRERLERCKGAAPALAQRLKEDAKSRACIAPMLATISPAEALVPLADAIAATDETDRQTRTALRAAVARALAVAERGRLAALLGDARRSALARLEMMRAAEARVTEAPSEAEATIAELLTGAPATRVRYLVLGPLGELARAGDRAAAARVANALAHDAEWPVRARAAEVARGIADAQSALTAAARDPEPRVREASLAALAQTPPPDAVRAAVDSLTHDGWSFVKVQALGLLMNSPASGSVDDALAGALHDRSARVRGGVLVALSHRRAASSSEAIRERLDDEGEDSEVRAAAARALGAVCDAKSADRLTEIARTLGVPGTDEDGQRLALGALVGLAALQPKDLRVRVAPLLAPSAPPYVRAAAERALAARSMCH